MKGFRIYLNLEELFGDNFKLIKGQQEACKEEQLIEVIEKLTNNLKEFIKSNKL